MEARAAVEALRAGTVNRYVVRFATYGHEERLRRLTDTIRQSPGGSVQAIVGEYGSGKSHVSELLAARMEQEGYAVARLELGASHGRAESPRGVVGAVERAISMTVDGRAFRGADDLGTILKAAAPPSQWDTTWEASLVRAIHERLPGRDNFLARFDRMRTEIPRFWGQLGLDQLPRHSLRGSVPAEMTATNKAVAALNGLAHNVVPIGIRGLVLILDEAERAEWAASNYRLERARNLVIGLSMAAANLDTSRLKHHRNNLWPSYRPYAPSRMHVLLAFTTRWGLCDEVRQAVGVSPDSLGSFSDADRVGIARQIGTLYRTAYGDTAKVLTPEDWRRLSGNAAGGDVRSFVRGVVSALDYRRLRAGHGR